MTEIIRASTTPWRATADLLTYYWEEGVGSPWRGADDTRQAAEEIASRIQDAFRVQAVPREFDSGVVLDVVRALPEDLTTAELAYATATGLDRAFAATFTQSWLGEKPPVFVLDPGEPFPISDMRLMGGTRYSARPHRLNMPDHELPHVRSLSQSEMTVRIDARYAASLDGLGAGDPLSVAAVIVNEDRTELDAPDALFPIVAKDPVKQRARVKRSVAGALSRGAVVVVVPELSIADGNVGDIEELLDQTVGSAIVFAGSAHVRRGSVRVNEGQVILPEVGVAWSHDKLVPYETRDGSREGIDQARPEVTIACGNHVRVALLICKDVLTPQYHRLLGDLGVHLLGVPAMSAGLGDFTGAAHALVARSQGAMVVANKSTGLGRGWCRDRPPQPSRSWPPEDRGRTGRQRTWLQLRRSGGRVARRRECMKALHLVGTGYLTYT